MRWQITATIKSRRVCPSLRFDRKKRSFLAFSTVKSRCRSMTGRQRLQRHARVGIPWVPVLASSMHPASAPLLLHTGSSGKNHNSFVLYLTRLRRQKKNQPRSTRASQSAGRRPASIRPWDSAGRCLRHFFRCAIARLTVAPFKCMAPVPSLWQKSPDMPEPTRARTLSTTRPIIPNYSSLVVGSVSKRPIVCDTRCHSIVACCEK